MDALGANSTGYVPLYQQIKRLITESLVSGEWAPGEPIPSEFELASRYSVSQGTVRKAISELASQKVLVRHQGKGTFVASHSQESTNFPFLRIAPDDSVVQSVEATLIDLWRIKLDEISAAKLLVSPGASGWLIRRLLSVEGKETLYEEIRLPGDSFETVEEQLVLDHNCMLYSMYESEVGIRILNVEESLKAVTADGEITKRLKLPESTPLLRVDRIAFTYGDKPVELRRGFCNTSNHHYRNRIV